MTVVFCITCRGRSDHLRQTLPLNYRDNLKAKFVVLDYGDEGGLAEFMHCWGSRERVTYVRIEADRFRMAHAKNVAHRVGIRVGGNILVNLDADNLTGAGFDEWLEENVTTENFAWARMIPGVLPRGISGRIAVHRNMFMAAGGYDERFDTWSPDDKDFNERLRRLGFKAVEIPDRYLGGVRHNDRLRFKEYPEAQGKSYEDWEAPCENTVVNGGVFGCAVIRTPVGYGCEWVAKLRPLPTRVFGIGMHKTGTTSLAMALSVLGMDCAHWKNAHWAKSVWTEMMAEGRSSTLEKNYSSCDLPITILFRELNLAYPGSKFILTLRDEESWLRSVERHWDRDVNKYRGQWDVDPFTHKIHRLVYGRKSYDRDTMLERYRRHTEEVVDYFKGENLLVMSEPNWDDLCSFLDVPRPACNYPWVNPYL